MKPNKIYLSKLVMAGAEILDKPVSDGDIEYIRKDFLLEWLEAKVYEYNEDKFDDGFNTALGQVIDKINTL